MSVKLDGSELGQALGVALSILLGAPDGSELEHTASYPEIVLNVCSPYELGTHFVPASSSPTVT